MTQVKTPKRSRVKNQKAEVTKILANFYKESSAIVNAAIKDSHRKYPNLFKPS
jgi:hypothetical protein